MANIKRMVHAASDVGNKYKQDVVDETPAYAQNGMRMEDVSLIRVRDNGAKVLIAIADGHGSEKIKKGVHIGGRECANAAVACVMKNEHLLKTHTDADADMSLRTMFAKCHEAIKELDLPTQTWTADGVRMLKSINGRSVVPACGTTLSVCYLNGRGNAVFSFVGDSLGFVIRRNGDVEMLGSVGHNPLVNSEETKRLHNVHEARVVAARGGASGGFVMYTVGSEHMKLALTRSLGHVGHEHIIKTEPETQTFSYSFGDTIVVATDGIWEAMSRDEVASIVRASASDTEACENVLNARRSRPPFTRDNAIIAVHSVTRPLSAPSARHACCVVS